MLPIQRMLFALILPTAAALSGCGGSSPPVAVPKADSRPEIAAGAYVAGELSQSRETYSGQQLDRPLVTKFERDGSGGFDITYRINGDDRTISFAADDYDQVNGQYIKNLGNWEYNVVIDPKTRNGEGNVGKPLGGASEFEHFNSHYTEAGEHDGPLAGDPLLTYGAVGYFVHGRSTPILPAGEATYSGRFLAKYYVPVSVAPDTPSEGFLHSDNLSLTLDFADNTVSGTIDGIEDLTEDPSNPIVPLTGQFTIDGTINGSSSATGFDADLTGTEDLAAWQIEMEGQAFGPQAEEAGGVLRGTNTENDYGLIGFFGVNKP